MEYQRLVWILLMLMVWSINWLLRGEHVLSLPLVSEGVEENLRVCIIIMVSSYELVFQ